jgi:hypothetical protein
MRMVAVAPSARDSSSTIALLLPVAVITGRKTSS